MSAWNPRIPFNVRTAVFCFLMGVVLSKLVGLFPTRFLLFEPPDALNHWYPFVVRVAFWLLPFWSLGVVREDRPLPALGLITFYLDMVYSTLFPAISD